MLLLPTSASTHTSFNPQTSTDKKKKMDRGMVGALPTEKLGRSNYATWEYKIHRYLLRHGYWSYIVMGMTI